MAEKILLVEDDQSLRLLVKNVLCAADYDFLEAASGEEGLEKLLAFNPDLVILDNMMPKKSGEEVLDEVMTSAKYESVRNTPIIMLTAKQMDEAKIKALLERGLAAHLMKPFGQRELLNIMRNILATHEIQLRRKQLLKAVRKAKDFLSILVEGIPDAIFIVNLDGEIEFYNGGHKDVLGYDLSDLQGKPISGLLAQDSISISEMLGSLGNHHKKTNIDLNFLSSRGEKIPFNMSIAKFLNKRDEVTGFILIGSDISEIKRLEKELIEKEKLELFYETAVAINHEVNNPLAPILGNVQLILEEKNTLDKHTRQRLQVVLRNANRIREITQKLSDIKHPVHTSYLGETKMVDIRESD